jgi:DNA-binding NarL/FixJ family response regulator
MQLMKQEQIMLYVGTDKRHEMFAADENWVVFHAPTLRDALAQTIFSYPDVIVIDAGSDMLLAEDAFFHLRTIEHPPILLLSNMPNRWDMRRFTKNPVVVLSEDADHEAIRAALISMLQGDVATLA